MIGTQAQDDQRVDPLTLLRIKLGLDIDLPAVPISAASRMTLRHRDLEIVRECAQVRLAPFRVTADKSCEAKRVMFHLKRVQQFFSLIR